MEHWDVSLTIGNNISGRLLLVLLEQIQETGSINKAVDVAGISYRSGWSLLNKTEETLGKKLILRQSGGQSGGGSALTEDGIHLLGHLQSLHRDVASQLSTIMKEDPTPNAQKLMMASTTEPIATGLLDVLIGEFYKDTGISVFYTSAGSGQALEMAKAGRVDVVLTHAPRLEEEFVREGWGVERSPFMKDRFILVGPREDPADVRGAQSIFDALKRIAKTKCHFVSRGDRSGTHIKEQDLWQEAGLDPEGQSWYQSAQRLTGNTGVLEKVKQEKAYALIDRASFQLAYEDENVQVLFDKGDELENLFSVMAVSRKKAAVNQNVAEQLVRWLISKQGQAAISSYHGEGASGPMFQSIRS